MQFEGVSFEIVDGGIYVVNFPGGKCETFTNKDDFNAYWNSLKSLLVSHPFISALPDDPFADGYRQKMDFEF